ncbi:MAG: FAD:protein FMN transferase [Gammaproteobacteria bacterium]|nr:FAD:protein FMN transferase [Gammaproteobacteria bacterium]
MGGPCRFLLDHADEGHSLAAIAAAESEVRRLEQKYSRYLDDSITSQINRAAGTSDIVAIDSETAGLLSYADTLWQQSAGLFDLTAGVLRQAWNFKSGKLPSQAQLDELLPLIAWEQVRWDRDSICLPVTGMEIDFGGCVKEYASDSAAAILRSHAIEHGLVNLAGDIAVIGKQADGQAWQISIRHPRHDSHAIALVSLPAGGLASSGDYERCIEIDGQRYSHILNPETGWPVDGLAAVSVIADQCLVAGSTATIGMLKPRDQALSWLEELGLAWLAIDADLQCHGTIKLH